TVDSSETCQSMAENQTSINQSSPHPSDPDAVSDLCQSLAAANTRHAVPVSCAMDRHQSMYKNRGRAALDQVERRRKELELQKQRRFNAMSLARRLAEDDWTTKDVDENDDLDDDLVSVADTNETLATEELTADDTAESLQRKRRPGKNYRNQLMLSEWLMEIPDNLETEFLLKLCPQGKRVLVVAAKGITKTFDRRGRCIMTFPSELPGGCRQFRAGLTVLDCIWDTSSFHVLDIMHWRDLQLYDTETSLRFHWLETNFVESAPNVCRRTPKNRHPFLIVESHSCQRECLAEFLTLQPPFPLDGVLFYHQRGAYTFGHTSLVGWLKPYMLTEVLGLPCHQHYSIGLPADYQGWLVDVERFEATRRQMALAYSQDRQLRRQQQQTRSENSHSMVD
ncbi:hypothetical protein BOX15_Mlig024661g1, partial [Macrostomum lignano]